MQPIPPPPRYNARPVNRSKIKSSLITQSGSPVKNWFPFADGDDTRSPNMKNNARAGSDTSDIGTEEIEIKLGPPSMGANNSVDWDWASKTNQQ